MKRQSRPLRSSKGDFFRAIDLRIMEYELMREEISKEIRRYIMSLQKNHDGELRSIDYTVDKVVSGSKYLDFLTAIHKIEGLQTNLNQVLKKISELKRKKKKLIEIYKQDETIEAKVFYYREILQYSQEMTAMQVGYSVRQIQRIEKKLKEIAVSESDTL